MDPKKDALKSFLMATGEYQQKRRTSPFMQFFLGGKCTLCSREFRGLKASNGKRHLEMKHPIEYQQILAQKRAGRVVTSSGISTTNRNRVSKLNSMVAAVPQSSSIGSSTDDDSGSTDDVVLVVDSPPPCTSAGSEQKRQSVDEIRSLDDEIKRCVIALEAAARPLRRLSLFAATFGISADFIENKHFCGLLQMFAQIPLPTPLELEHQINLEISDILLRIHRLLNALPCGFCVSADVVSTQSAQYTMGIVAHFWNEDKPDQAALDIIQLQDRPTLEFVAETLKHAFDKTDLNATKIYRTIVESSSNQQSRFTNLAKFDSTTLKMDERNYSPLFVGSCASFRLRSTCDDVFSTDPEAVELREKTLSLLDQIAKNATFLDEWRKQTGGELAFPATLNWHSISAVYEQIFAHTNVFGDLCAAHGLNVLDANDRNLMSAFLSLSGTIEKFAERLEDDRQPTCSFLFPGLKQLLHELKITTVKPRLSHVLRTALSSRFVDVLTSTDEDGDPFYLTAALLNPTVASLCRNYEHVSNRAIRTICFRILGKRNPLLQILNSSTTPTQSRVEDSLDREIADYLKRVMVNGNQEDAFEFWQRESRSYEILATVARSVLTVPATSTAARRLLRTMSDQQHGGREAWKRSILTFNDSFIAI
ncbi:hypothetical protein M3Y96_00973400 [Aphelenchoides besseyi]|nr:hypothetical protein M3Y96_00973400 [Aphelenchoides besseyi]